MGIIVSGVMVTYAGSDREFRGVDAVCFSIQVLTHEEKQMKSTLPSLPAYSSVLMLDFALFAVLMMCHQSLLSKVDRYLEVSPLKSTHVVNG